MFPFRLYLSCFLGCGCPGAGAAVPLWEEATVDAAALPQGTAQPLGHHGSTSGDVGLKKGKMMLAARSEGRSVRSGPVSPEGLQTEGSHCPVTRKHSSVTAVGVKC